MKKIPALFEYVFSSTAAGGAKGGNAVYSPTVKPEARWVLEGEGIATEKIDGTACLVQDGKLWKRYDRKKANEGKPFPAGWMPAQDKDEKTGHWPGWLPIGAGPEDQWHREALRGALPPPGTYELIGPKVQGNPYGLAEHRLVRHGESFTFGEPWNFDAVIWGARGVPRDRENLISYLRATPEIEGLVFHHPDGRMAKVTRKGFGLPWPAPKEQTS